MNYLAEARGKDVSRVYSRVIFHSVCLRSSYRSWSREKENERKVGHAMNAEDRCSRSFARGLSSTLGSPRFPLGSWKITTRFILRVHVDTHTAADTRF